jgi:anti-sigma B factor antagonist
LRSEREQSRHVVAVSGELDLSCVELLEEEMERIFDGDASVIVLDLSKLEFIDSIGIQLLQRLQARSSEDGDRLRLIHGAAPVQRVLELTRADRLISFA